MGTTTLAAASGGLCTCLIDKAFLSKTWSVQRLCNGIISGLVSITAGCANVHPAAALLIGGVGALVYLGASIGVLRCLKVDDPLEAFAVHGVCGVWGLISTAFLADPAYGLCSGTGVVHGGWQLLAAAVVGGGAIISLVCTLTLAI